MCPGLCKWRLCSSIPSTLPPPTQRCTFWKICWRRSSTHLNKNQSASNYFSNSTLSFRFCKYPKFVLDRARMPFLVHKFSHSTRCSTGDVVHFRERVVENLSTTLELCTLHRTPWEEASPPTWRDTENFGTSVTSPIAVMPPINSSLDENRTK